MKAVTTAAELSDVNRKSVPIFVFAGAADGKIGQAAEGDNGLVVGICHVCDGCALHVDDRGIERPSDVFAECLVVHEGLTGDTVAADHHRRPMLKTLAPPRTLRYRRR